ncbi:uncharacterized protein LOC133887834 [Phragmites australis]|uniref:uncharacterized protein LOC133887834 n=1 Tax=Phragmites australis TaxID=29695 RepID=UPI002D798C98|nr:uncharacterized protein LOC133887834 [Phragmites australis]
MNRRGECRYILPLGSVPAAYKSVGSSASPRLSHSRSRSRADAHALPPAIPQLPSPLQNRAHGSGGGERMMDGDEWRCRRHPALPCGGVCPHCLRDRLLRLCLDCACPRPCPCASSVSSPSSSSSAASGSALGRVHSLIERESRVARSRSVAASSGGGVGVGDDQRRAKSRVWGWVSFRKPAGPVCRDVEEEYDEAVALARSRSVSTAAAKRPSKAGVWGKLIPGKIKALRNRKASVR